MQRKTPTRPNRVALFLDAYLKKRRIDNLSPEERKDLKTFTQTKEELMRWVMVEKGITNTNALSYACIKYDAQSNLDQYHKLEQFILNGYKHMVSKEEKEDEKIVKRKRKRSEDGETSKNTDDSPPLINLLFPSFQHTFIDLLVNGYKLDAIDFLKQKESLFADESTYKHLRSITDTTTNLATKSEFQSLKMDTKALNQYIYEMKTKKYRVVLAEEQFNNLLAFLKVQETMFLLQIINRYMNLIVTTEDDETGCSTNYLINEPHNSHHSNADTFERQSKSTDTLTQADTNTHEDKEKVKQNEKEEDKQRNKQGGNGCEGGEDGEGGEGGDEVREEMKKKMRRLFSRCADWTLLPQTMTLNFANINSGITQLNISHSGKRVVACYENSAVNVWSEESEEKEEDGEDTVVGGVDDAVMDCSLTTLRGHTKTVYDAEFLKPDDDWLITGSADKTVRLWSVEKGRDMVSYRGHSGEVVALAVSPILGQFSSCSIDTTAKLWTTDRIYPLRSFIGHTRAVNCLGFHPNGCYLASGGTDGTVRMWDVNADGRCVRLMASDETTPITALQFSPDGMTIAAGAIDNSIRVWDLGTGSLIITLRPPVIPPSSTIHPSTIHPSTIPSSTNHPSTTQHSSNPPPPLQPVHSIIFNHQANQLFSGGLDGMIRAWDLKVSAKNDPLANDSKNVSESCLMRCVSAGGVIVKLNHSPQNILHVLTKSPLT